MTTFKESTTSSLLSSVEVSGQVVAPIELAAFVDVTVLNDNLVRLYVKAFGWEVNRNNFLFNKKALLAEHEDALGNFIPAWKSFENQLVNANHLMADNKNSRVDRVIGFIEDAELKDDGVYLTLITWKRTMTEDQLTQIREGEVSVSMEVTYNNPRVIVDGEMYPPSEVSYDPRTTVRTMADDSVLSFVGIAILFDGIKPGFESQEVLLTENAALEDGSLVSRDTHTEVSMDLKELEKEMAALKERLEASESALANKDTELAAAQEALNAKYAELEKVYAELETLRKQAFDETVAKCFDLGKLSASTAAWLLDMIRWSGCIEETAAKLAEIAGCVKCSPAGDGGMGAGEMASADPAAPAEPAPAAAEGASADPADCEDGTCGECSACKKKASAASESAGAEGGEPAPAPENQENASAGDPPAADPAPDAGVTETAAATIVNLAGEGSGTAPRYDHRYL